MPEQLKKDIEALIPEVRKLRRTWRWIGWVVLAVVVIGALFIASNRQATHQANRAIAGVQALGEQQSRDLACIKRAFDASQTRSSKLEVARARLDAQDGAYKRAVQRVIADVLHLQSPEGQRRFLRAVRREVAIGRRDARAQRHYELVQKRYPIPTKARFPCVAEHDKGLPVVRVTDHPSATAAAFAGTDRHRPTCAANESRHRDGAAGKRVGRHKDGHPHSHR